MTILLYEYHDLEERESNHLRAWKVCHITLYTLAAIFGILNYTFLFETKSLVNDQCMFYPGELDFHWVKLPNVTDERTHVLKNKTDILTNEYDAQNVTAPTVLIKNVTEDAKEDVNNATDTDAQTTPVPVETKAAKTVKRETPREYVSSEEITTVEETNGTMITENSTHRLMLNKDRTLFRKETDGGCQFAEYMPLMSATVAIVWATLFIMCPNGGRARTGLQQPWRILAPALLFALLMVILTGVSFTSTNGGLQSFCAAFHSYTNTTTCSAVSPLLERSWNASWPVGARVAATRAASAAVWASWACACALLLARCLAAPDFVVKRTSVHLVRDPQEKVTPYLLQKSKSPKRSLRSAHSSPSKRDSASIRSEPTNTTELVIASVEHNNEPDSQPTSLIATPLKERLGEEFREEIEMMYNPKL